MARPRQARLSGVFGPLLLSALVALLVLMLVVVLLCPALKILDFIQAKAFLAVAHGETRQQEQFAI